MLLGDFNNVMAVTYLPMTLTWLTTNLVTRDRPFKGKRITRSPRGDDVKQPCRR